MWPTPAIVWDPWRCPLITRHVRRHNAKNLVQNEVFSHDLQCVEYGPQKLQKTQFSLVPELCLDDSTQTKPPACPHGVGGCSPRCRIAWNGLHHPRESISAPIDVLEIWTYGGLGMEKRQPYISFMRASLNPCIHEQAALNSCRCSRYSVIEPASQPRAGGRQIWPGQ